MKKVGTVSLHTDEGTYVAAFTYFPGHPGCWYRRNGDPGDPPEPDEIEIGEVVLNWDNGLAETVDNPSDDLIEKLDQAVYDQMEEA